LQIMRIAEGKKFLGPARQKASSASAAFGAASASACNSRGLLDFCTLAQCFRVAIC
jgi:hypothetical protein